MQFGISTDKPVVGDYDSDGKANIAVYRPSSGIWYLLRSSQGFTAFQWGKATDIPAPADYDGDGKTDTAVYRDSSFSSLPFAR
ncbi:MAG: VCBS repeat-containing protein [Acidobacteriota bacterium]|nr:VCBS repeat-containing protein [Acidobacteriota bacterium]